ncbi:hypothetical protein R4P47_08065 [Rhodococcus sp. IEGM 1370]|uniref:hypothetical protein n=1 Tax=Rhodococcus sp. IEGM 1370 TaxID=3082222 RepID=UPI002952DD57|nr:hypothetical protein [Rhodococcus sp. IEGM 1370]MDV8076509.1 hypothetical protein [Rhodococcus sp. IEGM 1370]
METKTRAGHKKSRAPGGTRDLLTGEIAHHQSKLPNVSNVTTAQSNTATTSIETLIERINDLERSDTDTVERTRFSWLSRGAAAEFAAESVTRNRRRADLEAVDRFFAGLQWTMRTTWSSDRYEITPTTELLVHPSIRSGGDFGVVLRGEGWRCTRNGGCGYEDLAGQVMRRGSVEIVDLAATVTKLSTGTS